MYTLVHAYTQTLTPHTYTLSYTHSTHIHTLTLTPHTYTHTHSLHTHTHIHTHSTHIHTHTLTPHTRTQVLHDGITDLDLSECDITPQSLSLVASLCPRMRRLDLGAPQLGCRYDINSKGIYTHTLTERERDYRERLLLCIPSGISFCVCMSVLFLCVSFVQYTCIIIS